MGTFDLYSKRQKKLRGEEPDIFTYDKIPKKLRIQIHHIVTGTIGNGRGSSSEVKKIYHFIHNILCKEYGVFHLFIQNADPKLDILNFLLENEVAEQTLDVIELIFRMINTYIREKGSYYHEYLSNVSINPDDAIDELNERFRENGVGYRFESNQIIRIDSTYAHSEITRPTLSLLSNPVFANANEEYLKAHEHYRHSRNKECLTECLKAFESVMKIISKKRGWIYDEKDTASKLIKVCLDKGLVPTYLQNQFTSLRMVLESGIPTIRNKIGGHGQGHEKKEADDHLVRYALNLTGSNIIFLVEQSGLV